MHSQIEDDVHFISRGPGNVEKAKINEGEEFLTFKLHENVKSRHLPDEEKRTRFSGSFDYWLYCFSLTGSLANMTRFPYLVYTYNGCSFIVQFLILTVIAGIPWCFMETALGQFSGRGPTAIGDMVPAGKGIALAMGYVCLLNVICYSPIQSRCLIYMFKSFTSELPWSECVNKTVCMDESRNVTDNFTKSSGVELRLPVENYYINVILNMDKSVLIDGLGDFQYPLLLCLAISWLINYFLLISIDNYMRYVQIFGSVAPYIFLISLLAIILVQEDALIGVKTLFDPSSIDLLDLHGWRRAAEQVFYSLDVGTGHLILYGKKCKFRNNTMDNILIVTLLDVVCCISASVIIYSVIQKLAIDFHVLLQFVFVSGPGMFFLVVAHTVKGLPYPNFFNFLAFFILFVLSILTQMSFLHPVHYLLNEYFGQRKYTKLYYPLYICCTMFILSLMTVTRGGDALISLLDDIGAAMGILMITISEAVFVFAIYGLNEFFADLAFMTDNPPTMIMKIFFVAGPIIIIHILLASFFHWNPPTFQNVTYPITFYSLAWVLADITFVIIIGAAIWTIIEFISKGNIRGAFEPTENWVPDLMYSLQNKSLRNMMNTRDHDKVKKDNPIIFEFGKPKMSMRFDIATQTNDSGIDDDHISDKRFQHLYLDFVKHFYNTDYELIRRYNETEVLSWNSIENMEFLLSYGVLEKSVQTELESK